MGAQESLGVEGHAEQQPHGTPQLHDRRRFQQGGGTPQGRLVGRRDGLARIRFVEPGSVWYGSVLWIQDQKVTQSDWLTQFASRTPNMQ